MSAPPTARTADAVVATGLMLPTALLLLQDGGAQLLGLVFTAALLASAVVVRRPVVGSLGQMLAHLLSVAAGLALLLGLSVQQPRFGLIVSAAFLAFAVPRLYWRNERVGRMVTLGIGLVALMGFARATSRPVFGTTVVLYLATMMAASMHGEPTWRGMPRRLAVIAPLAAAFSLSLGVMLTLAWGLPAAEPAVSEALRPYLFGGEAQSGFADGTIRLGSISRITTSNDVVMRVYGQADHLRGQVYVEYRAGSWYVRPRLTVPDRTVAGGSLPLAEGAATAGEVRVEADPSAGPPLFAPLDAVEVAGAPEGTRLDAFGVLTPPSEMADDPRTWRLRLGRGPPAGRAVPPRSVHGRRPDDLVVPPVQAPVFRALAEEWTAGAATDAARVDALVGALRRELRYSLEPEPAPVWVDATVHFLQDSRRGHCELFASAFVLLARSVGVPARLVAGYRVFELNPVGGYHIVRKRDAHAWAEVWLDDRWHTVDPTPPGVLGGEMVPETGWLAGHWDVVRRALGLAFERLAVLSAVEVLAAIVVVAGLVLLVLVLRRRRLAWAAARARAPEIYAPLARLESWLAGAAGLPRPPSETLEQYAERLRAADQPQAAALVDACARLRYGGQGDPAALVAAVDALVAERPQA